MPELAIDPALSSLGFNNKSFRKIYRQNPMIAHDELLKNIDVLQLLTESVDKGGCALNAANITSMLARHGSYAGKVILILKENIENLRKLLKSKDEGGCEFASSNISGMLYCVATSDLEKTIEELTSDESIATFRILMKPESEGGCSLKSSKISGNFSSVGSKFNKKMDQFLESYGCVGGRLNGRLQELIKEEIEIILKQRALDPAVVKSLLRSFDESPWKFTFPTSTTLPLADSSSSSTDSPSPRARPSSTTNLDLPILIYHR